VKKGAPLWINGGSGQKDGSKGAGARVAAPAGLNRRPEGCGGAFLFRGL